MAAIIDIDPLNNTTGSSQLLSIPSDQPEPPKHSTPKRDENGTRPLFDESSIYDQMSDGPLDRINREKEDLIQFLDNELKKKKRDSKTVNQQFTDIHNQRIPGLDTYSCAVSSGDTTRNSGGLHGKILKYESPLQRAGSVASSRTDTLFPGNRRNLLGIQRGKSQLNFGYLSIGESLLLRQRVWNCDGAQLRIRCSILSLTNDEVPEENPFKVVELSTPIMEPGEWCDITVQYTPARVERNIARLAVDRENGDAFRYSFTLIGNGGRANVQLAESNFNDGIAVAASSSQAIIIRPDIFNRFVLTFENIGQRPAFVSIISADVWGNILSKAQMAQISFIPHKFVLGAAPNGQGSNEDGKHKINVIVNVSESFSADTNVEMTSITNAAMEGKGLVSGKRFGYGGGCRDSLMTISTGAGSTNNLTSQTSVTSCAFRIIAHWGEESQRQRLKIWEMARKEVFFLNGLRFTDHFKNEEQGGINLQQRQRLNIIDTENADFKNSLRIIKCNVVDQRATTHFPSQPDAIDPLITMFKNECRLLREVCPGEETGNASSSSLALTIPYSPPNLLHKQHQQNIEAPIRVFNSWENALKGGGERRKN